MASNILTDAELAKIRERVSVAFVTGEPSVCNPPQYYGPSQGEYIRVLDSHAALTKQAEADRRDAERYQWLIQHQDVRRHLQGLIAFHDTNIIENTNAAIDATLLAATAAKQTKED